MVQYGRTRYGMDGMVWYNVVEHGTFKGGNFSKFRGFMAICESFSMKFGGMASFGGTIGGTSKQSTNVLSSLQKFSAAKVSCYTIY